MQMEGVRMASCLGLFNSWLQERVSASRQISQDQMYLKHLAGFLISDNVIKKNTHNYVFPASMETRHASFIRERDYENLPGCLFALEDTFMHFTHP